MKATAKFKWLIVFADGSTLRIRGNPATKEEARAAYLRQFKKKILPRGSKIVYGNPADYDYAARLARSLSWTGRYLPSR